MVVGDCMILRGIRFIDFVNYFSFMSHRLVASNHCTLAIFIKGFFLSCEPNRGFKNVYAFCLNQNI